MDATGGIELSPPRGQKQRTRQTAQQGQKAIAASSADPREEASNMSIAPTMDPIISLAVQEQKQLNHDDTLSTFSLIDRDFTD